MLVIGGTVTEDLLVPMSSLATEERTQEKRNTAVLCAVASSCEVITSLNMPRDI